ncbi:hemolysin activation/secretion protein [Sphingomonas endophytica]|uniref:Hemolysin activation/secretion protein n=2 Tax=Sphingomonas endophytica TaxID=869719 RepID=A0A7X0J9U4_9SPHN|nr:hemolysin activation/secretion protein [Sphingomonas endophytica]
MKSVKPTMASFVPMLLVAALPAPSTAQERPTTPDSVPSREQVQRPAPATMRNDGTRVQVDASRVIDAAPCPLAGSSVLAKIDRIHFVSADGRALPAGVQKELDAVELANQDEQSIAVVCRLRDAAADALRRAGFIASVQIPPQEIIAGELTLTVLLAHLVDVQVRGDVGPHRSALLARIRQIKAIDPLNERTAERILLLAGDIPGLDIQLALRPAGTNPGEVIGEITVVRRRYAVLANVQNYGSRRIGRETAYARTETYGLLTASDTAYVGASFTPDFREQLAGQAGYLTGLGSRGTTVGVRMNYALSRPDLGLLDLRSRSLIAGVDLAVPVVRTVSRNLTLGAGAELIEQRSRVYVDERSSALNRDKLRVVYLRGTGSVRSQAIDGSELASLSGTIELRRGLGVLGATPRGLVRSADGYTPSRFGGDPQALVVRTSLDGFARAGALSVASGIRGQWSNNALLNFEGFSVGNLSVGRGYDPGSNSGDRAIGFQNEFRIDVPLISSAPCQLFGFNDVVWLWNLERNTTENGRRLRSIGGGLRLFLPGSAILDVAYARPLDRALSFDDRRPQARLLLSLTAQFAPYAH